MIFLWLFRDYIFSFLTFLSLRLEGKEPDFPVLNSLRDDLIHERKKKIASLEIILSTWEKGESISTHLNYFKDLIGQLNVILKDQRRNLLLVSSDPFLWVSLNNKVLDIMKALKRTEKSKEKVPQIRNKLTSLSEEAEKLIDKVTQRFTFSLNEVIREAVKIVRTEKDRILKEKGITIEEKYEEIGDRFRLSYKGYKDWQKLISNLIRNGVEAVEAKLLATSSLLPATSYMLQAGVVRVGVEGRGDEVAVVVEDNGVGMDEKTKETFYKRGFTKDKETGLGLGITEETVEFVNKYGSWNIESKMGEGTRIEIKIDKEKAKEQDLKVEDSKAFIIKLRSRKVSIAVLGVLILIFVLVIYFQLNKYARFWEDWNPAFAVTDGNHLIVKNKANKVLWDIFLPTPIKSSLFLEKPLVRLSDLNGDGKTEVLVALNYDERNTGKVICLDYKKEKLWEFLLGDAGVYQIGEELNSGYFYPIDIEAEDLDGDSKKEIIVNSGEVRWFPNQLAVLDYKGKKLYEYWHPGIFYGMQCFDFDRDGEKEIILCGVNNRIDWRPVLSILDPARVYGQAMPYIAKKEIEKAKEEWYIVFPNIKKKLPEGIRWESFLSWVTNVQVLSEEDKITAGVIDGRNYDLTLNLNYNSVYFNLGGYLDWKKARFFPYDITKEDEDTWKNIEVYKEGVRIR